MFTVTGLRTLSVAMVLAVLERQGRSALSSDAVISAILGQSEIKITSAPIQLPRCCTKSSGGYGWVVHVSIKLKKFREKYTIPGKRIAFTAVRKKHICTKSEENVFD
ncbi:hypothetical protein KIN20_029632 [Parelaphostrongylus tenuis]|uniref:Secreted protein n=1 Tax=Parelaphostrongylus tenuis TaxID=148309 RepID=A0AAD5WFN1_PARTN|nr:hypothetical protein KIN20_029632 [Parelaphostrongylus tenuis]